MGTLELNRTYTFLFEGTLLPVPEQLRKESNVNFMEGAKLTKSVFRVEQEIGTVSLNYRQRSKSKQVSTPVTIQRTDDERRNQRTNKQAVEIYQILDAMRSSHPDAQLEALRARLAVYQREGADLAMITLVKRAIDKLERSERLSADELRWLGADDKTVIEESLRNR